MAVYKVIQDIEAEDKLLGPLTLKGFIYAGIAFTCAFIEFKLLFIGSPVKWLFIFAFALPMILFGILASPLGREQPTEVWLLSRVRFFLKPRVRIWDQAGLQELVTITVPKKIAKRLTKDLAPNEVESRLKTLAMTLDTRGWAIKNVDVNLNTKPGIAGAANIESDRLVGRANLAHTMPVADVHAADDILDEQNNPTAQKFAALMAHQDDSRRHGLLDKVRGIIDREEDTRPAPIGHLSGMNARARAQKELLKKEEKAALDKKLAEARGKFSAERDAHGTKANSHHKVLTSTPRAADAVKDQEPPAKDPAQKPAVPPVTPERQAANMELAQSGNAFSVATLATLANRQPKIEQTGPNEVTISLH